MKIFDPLHPPVVLVKEEDKVHRSIQAADFITTFSPIFYLDTFKLSKIKNR